MTESELWPIIKHLAHISIQCFSAAKKLKDYAEQRKKRTSETNAVVIEKFEFSKSLKTKFEQRITTSIRILNLTSEQIREILAVEADPLVKQGLADKLMLGEVTPEFIEEIFIHLNPQLENSRAEIHTLALIWLEAIEKVVAEDQQLSNIIILRGIRSTHTELKTQGADVAKALTEMGQKLDERLDEVLAAVKDRQSGYSLATSEENEGKIPEALKTQNQRRFERAKTALLKGSMADAERDFHNLITDLESQGGKDHDLLLRSCLNLAASLWEQSKHQEAQLWFEKIYAASPNDWRAKRGKAFALINEGKINEALLLLSEIRKLRPEESEHVCNEAWVLKNNGRASEALQLLESRAYEDVHYYSILSLTYSRLEKFELAESAARKALSFESDSEIALTALSTSIGFPIMQKRERRETLAFIPIDTDRSRLLEAIMYAEKAAAILREHQRLNVLLDVLSNLTAYYPAVGNCGAGEKAANEALRINREDPTVLKNLWCIQMRTEQYEQAVATADHLCKIDNPIDWWERKAEGLISADKAQKVLDEWDKVKDAADFSENPALIGLVARALSRRNRTQDGLNLADNGLLRFPNDPVLLMDRGFLLEHIGKYDEAKASFEQAEITVTKRNQAEFTLCFGMFLFRRKEWQAAIDKFRLLGADNIHSPLLKNCLVCLYNLARYKECISLAELAIFQLREFDEDIYSIAARCHKITENFKRTRELSEILVTKNASRKLENAKLLALSYWQLDELMPAYDVLLRLLNEHPDELDCLVLMSAVCSTLHRHDEAISYSHNAVDKYPNSVEAHGSLINSFFALPTNAKKPNQSHLDAYYNSLLYLQNHESGILKPIVIEPDGRSLLNMVKARKEQVANFEKYFENHPLPMALFSKHLGHSIFSTWAAIVNGVTIKLRMSFGSLDEQRAEVLNVANNQEISLDLFALLTICHVKLLRLLPSLFKRIFVHSSIFDEIVKTIRDIEQHPEQSAIALINGKLVKYDRTHEQAQAAVRFLIEIRDFLNSEHVEMAGLFPETLSSGQSKLMIDMCSMAGVAPFLVAKEKATALYSDDACLRAIVNPDERPPAFCTQAVLRMALQRNLLSLVEYQDAIITLIRSNDRFVSEDAGILRRCYQISNGRMSPLIMTMINHVNEKAYDAESCLPVLAEFAVYIWCNREPTNGNTREEWILEIWRAISKATDSDKLGMQFIGKLAAFCQTRPCILFGIVNFLLFNSAFFDPIKLELAYLVSEAGFTLSRLTLKLNPWCAGLANDWYRCAALNNLLVTSKFVVAHKPGASVSGHTKKAEKIRKKHRK